jgi:hypothetical protein
MLKIIPRKKPKIKRAARWASTGNIFTLWTESTALHLTAVSCAACCEAHTNFADESACLKADNVRNEVVTIHRSQVVLKILSSLHVDIFRK